MKIDKLLAGTLAFIMVTGMIFPAYAGESEPVIKCYPIADGFFDPPVIKLKDQFGTEEVDPLPPVFVCQIAIKNGVSPPLVPQAGVIYPITGSIDPPEVSLTDQFGTEVVDPSPAVWVLLPAVGFDRQIGDPQEEGVEISDHFKFYPISGTIDPPLVNLVDKFGDDDADASPAKWLAVPTEKNDEPIEVDQHFKCYPFEGTVDPPPQDIYLDQFSFHVVNADPAGFYFTQADKDEVIISPPVGGEFLPLETTSLLLASAQTFSWMIPVVLSVLGIGLFVASRKKEC